MVYNILINIVFLLVVLILPIQVNGQSNFHNLIKETNDKKITENFVDIIHANKNIKRHVANYYLWREPNKDFTLKVDLVDGRQKFINLGNKPSASDIEKLINKKFIVYRDEFISNPTKILPVDDDTQIDSIKKSTLTIRNGDDYGQGVIVRKEQISNGRFRYLILTANHVWGDSNTEILLPLGDDGAMYKVVLRNKNVDAALIEMITSLDLPAVYIADKRIVVPSSGRLAILVGPYEGPASIPLKKNINQGVFKSKGLVGSRGTANDFIRSRFTCSAYPTYSGSGVFIFEEDEWQLVSICTHGKRPGSWGGYGMPLDFIHLFIEKYNQIQKNNYEK